MVNRLGSNLEVEFFDSVRERRRVVVSTATVSRGYLPVQARVYILLHDDRWAMGRVLNYSREDDGSISYLVRSPNKKDRLVPEPLLWARGWQRGGDPADVLAAQGAESQYWHDARWSAREALTRLSSAAGGMTALASASIDLVPHQVDAIRRVLLDPLQRYLLADEVGLGKTIEAVVIVAQTLQDDPRRAAVIVAPGNLVVQWQRELEEKVGLQAGGSVRVVGYEALADLQGPQPHLVVIDEAHRLYPGLSGYEALQGVIRGAEKLLLLSATPVVGNEEAFLRLLRWLDPERWENETLQRFRGHVERSQQYGRLLLGLRPDTGSFLLKQSVNSAAKAFPEDPTVERLAVGFGSAATDEERITLSSELRDHIADAYRIHHRIVRARRSALDEWVFKPRGPSEVREEPEDSSDIETAAGLLEDWRASAQLAAADRAESLGKLADRYVQMLECIGQGLRPLAEMECSEELFPGESELLELLRNVGRQHDGSAHAAFVARVVTREVDFLRRSTQTPKVAVFCSAAAGRVATAIRDSLPGKVVYVRGEHVPVALRRFQEDSNIQVAVFDRHGEEGLNLHFADAIVHADVPFALARMEQRIGRLDRFGRAKGPIRHALIYPGGNDESPWAAWVELLRSTVEIFDCPVSDLQFALESIEKGLWAHFLRNGGAAIDQIHTALRERLTQGRRRLDEQHSLDQLGFGRSTGSAVVEEMEEAEVDEAALERLVEPLLRTLGLHRRAAAGEVFSLAWTDRTLLPAHPWQPVFEQALRRPLTWRRRVAKHRPEVSLLRPGAPLLVALERLLDWDDRGTAFATWRFRPGWGEAGSERIVFRLCWRVGPQPLAGSGLQVREDRLGLYRRAASFLPQWTFVQYLDTEFDVISDDAVQAILAEPYRSDAQPGQGRDYNLGSRLSWLHDLIDAPAFEGLCNRAREIGERRLESSPEFVESTRAALDAAQREMDRRRTRFDARRAVDPTADPTGERDLAFDEAVREAVRMPEVRLDCIGVFVVAGYVPETGDP